jgi:hypothetical protein
VPVPIGTGAQYQQVPGGVVLAVTADLRQPPPVAMEQQTALTNVSSFLPSPADLIMAVPRLLSRASAWGEHLDSLLDKVRAPGSVIAQPTLANATNATFATTSGKFVQESVAAATAAGLQEDMGVFQALKNVGTFFSYITSKWAIATFTIVSLVPYSMTKDMILTTSRPFF